MKIRALNEDEKKAIRDALELFIEQYTPESTWAQRIILSDMLEDLMWIEQR